MIVWKSIEWWRTQHPGPVLEIRGGGGMAPAWKPPLWWNFLAMLLLFVALVLVRIGQESIKREIDSLRRYGPRLLGHTMDKNFEYMFYGF